jgi:hypothetical protein
LSSQFSWTVDPVFGCWNWTGKTDRRDGRALVWRGRTPTSAQRAVYEQEVGPIPEGKELDHMCRNTMCVAPHHAEPVTRVENEKRKSWAYRARRATCPWGHDMNNAATTPEGGRVCRQCNRLATGETT